MSGANKSLEGKKEMINMSEHAKKFLGQHIPEYEKYDLGDLLHELNYLIVREGMVRQQYLNELGHEAQLVYDELYDNN